MKFREFGSAENPVILMLHGGGLSWWSAESAARLLEKNYHVILPILDGHGENNETDFISIEDSAEKLTHFIDDHCGGHVFALCGLTLGAQIAASVLAARPEIADFSVLENTLIQPDNSSPEKKFLKPLASLFLWLVRFRPFAKLWSKTHSLPDDLFESYFQDIKRISSVSLFHIWKSNQSFCLPEFLPRTKAKVLILVSSRQTIEMKLSAGLLKKAIPGSKLIAFRGRHRGPLSISHSREYVRLLEQWVSGTFTP